MGKSTKVEYTCDRCGKIIIGGKPYSIGRFRYMHVFKWGCRNQRMNTNCIISVMIVLYLSKDGITMVVKLNEIYKA